jgi:hypothetical protein
LNLQSLFFSKHQPAFSLPFVFLLASKGRQNRPADAASPKKKNPSVAPAKLALDGLGLASQVQGYAPFFFPLCFIWLEQLRPRTLQDLSFFLRNGSPAKAGINGLIER